ncbi:uncharacterized protein L3040_004467 [Drepanopeziza brunnea f. sp. 'multigermtubi']|uniref:Rhamnogalacturonase A/B/Epimerase-like pectate lyase domain-containing protein n=2 Tax=Drepanopeziza brunnea f. sp. 'multigermtubi' TaxID=698441 RepID=K1WZ65_MARBU|nr:uncharacterized protein MBM_03699 [Drepanopeziza brunnea f. sp. 'multigermtubi' MB_m1]EKD17927.1 hypothetical protein MBM_03699 [Drepanopeziza brunnea f. sp. 'multigermtubi' MB_m1]KAJ5043081.1 hypothetical protein L3040_004467 [Drepanopeziza brunnea f. sp. 'multigermtubi']
MRLVITSLLLVAKASAGVVDRPILVSDSEIQSFLQPNGMEPEYLSDRAVCTGPAIGTQAKYWLDAQDHTGNARGYAPFLGTDYTYPVYRNVKTAPYTAKGNAAADDTAALQYALNNDGSGGTRYKNGVTIRPAVVFVPGGTYMISATLDMRLNTILIGDPANPPVFKATSAFSGTNLIQGYDFGAGDPTTNFFVALKNIVIDTTSIDKAKSVTGLGWGISQACHLTNIKINMPTDSGGHVGIDMTAGSAITVSDVSFVGGSIGIRVNNQQVNLKNLNFLYCTTAIKFGGGKTAVIQGSKIDTCGRGVDTTNSGQLGFLAILDTNVVNSGPVITFHDSSNDSGDRNNQIVIENLSHSGTNPIAVDTNGNVKLASTASVDTWIWGNKSPGGYTSGALSATPRPAALLSGGKYLMKTQPTYGQYASDQFVNVKSVAGFQVFGDGSTDDAASLNAILLQNAANCKITYFPYGVYIVKSTLYIPPGSRIVGEAWPVISGSGAAFTNAASPAPVVKVGNAGEIGLAEIQDMRFTVAGILPGATILQVNMAGSNPGDVAFWNTHVTVGGAADSQVNTACGSGNTAGCKAAFALVHLTASSSAYIENMWGWIADHSLDGGSAQNIAVGRGLLVEATKGTWIAGASFEHCVLYSYNFHRAQNVFVGMLQSETAYWQGEGAQQNAPAPWTASATVGDPDYSWCGGSDQKCRMGVHANIDGGKNLFLYAAGFWTFFHGETQTRYNAPETVCGSDCITNQIRVTGAPKALYWFGIATKSGTTMVLDGVSNPTQFNNPGGWSPGGVIAAYLQFSAA